MEYDIKKAEKSLTAEFEGVNEIRDYNQRKVLKAFYDNRVAPEHFYTVSGSGREMDSDQRLFCTKNLSKDFVQDFSSKIIVSVT